jgi:protein-S-isoprenylcysteine O-methyltransferase Ste14
MFISPLFGKVVWALGVVVWYAIRFPAQRRARRQGVVRSVGGAGDRTALVIAAIGQFLIPGVYAFTGWPSVADYPFHVLQAVIGMVVLVGALVLFRVTHKQLGRNWSVTLVTRSDHGLVTAGLYAWVRHPMYSSFLLFALAQLLLLPNWIAGLAGLVGFGVLFFYRVNREEGMMAETFGDAYRAYASRTARLVPWLY